MGEKIENVEMTWHICEKNRPMGRTGQELRMSICNDSKQHQMTNDSDITDARALIFKNI
jgi:hypothetical protein